MANNEWGDEDNEDDNDDEKEVDKGHSKREDIRGAFAKAMFGQKEPSKPKPPIVSTPQAGQQLSEEVAEFVINFLQKINIKATFSKTGKLTLHYTDSNFAALRMNRVLAEYGLSTSKLDPDKITELMNNHQQQEKFIAEVTAARAGSRTGSGSEKKDSSTSLVDKNNEEPATALIPPPPPPAPDLAQVVPQAKKTESPVAKKAEPSVARRAEPPMVNALAAALGNRRAGIAGNDEDEDEEENWENEKKNKKEVKAKESAAVPKKINNPEAVAALTQLHQKNNPTEGLKESRRELEKSIKAAKKEGDEDEVARQKAELDKVKQQQEKQKQETEHLAQQEHERKILSSTVSKDAEKIKKKIKSDLSELNEAVGKFKKSPTDEAILAKCNDVISEIEMLRSQLDQKFLLLVSAGDQVGVDAAEKIKEDLHLGKLEITLAQGINAAKEQIKATKEQHEREFLAEQQRQQEATQARHEEERKRMEDEKQRLIQEEKRQRKEQEAKNKLELEEQERQDQLRVAKEQEEARNEQKQQLQVQARTLLKANVVAAKEDPAAAELQRLSSEQTRLEQEHVRLKAEEAARAKEKATADRDKLQEETKAQEKARQEQDRARAAQHRALEGERQLTPTDAPKHPPIDNLITDMKTEKKHPPIDGLLTSMKKAKEEQDQDYTDKDETRRQTKIMNYLGEFGNGKSAIELVLTNRYQERRTEKKLLGLLQSFNVKTGTRVFSHKRNSQISELATIIEKLQKEKDLSGDEKSNIMHGALQTLIDSIHENEKNNRFKSRLLTVCEEMQKGLPHTKEPVEAATTKQLYASYSQGGAGKVIELENKLFHHRL